MKMNRQEKIKACVAQYENQIIAWRRDFHRHPEPSYCEERTANLVARSLKALGLEVYEGIGKTGVAAVLEGGLPGPIVALRADMDALKLAGESESEYASMVPGVMHACGHDGHTAMLLGAAHVLTKLREKFPGKVKFIFQHAEETAPGGALAFMEEGFLDDVDAIFGLHLRSTLEAGKLEIVLDKPIMAAADRFTVHLQGRGGHGSQPQECIDPILIASNIVMNCQSIVSRSLNPLDAGVISFGIIQAGSAFNVIPDKAYLEGTVRSFVPEVRQKIKEELNRKVAAACSMYGADYRFSYEEGYPPVNNHEKEGQLVLEVGEKVLGPSNVGIGRPWLAGEDFAYYLERVAGAFFFLGAGNTAKGIIYPHHHPRFEIDEDVLKLGTELLVNIAWEYNERGVNKR
jgi:amidohydrolase